MGILGLKPAQAKNLLPALYARREALKKEAESRRKIDYYFPDEGPYRRELYKKQVEFFAAGKVFKERMFMAGNRLGKSDAGSYEVACHATGEYPKWWVGRKFEGPVEIWAAGTTSETTRDIVQNKLLGGWGKKERG
jgi:hypothetical protein